MIESIYLATQFVVAFRQAFFGLVLMVHLANDIAERVEVGLFKLSILISNLVESFIDAIIVQFLLCNPVGHGF